MCIRDSFNSDVVYVYMVELHEAVKPIFTIIDTLEVNVPSAPWTDYHISLTRYGLSRAKVHLPSELLLVGIKPQSPV